MKAPLNKRITAYLIDITILIVVLGFISIFYKPDNSTLQNSMDLVTLEYVNGNYSFSDYIIKTSSLYKQMDHNNLIINVINLIFIIGYFIIFPYYNKGQTIGKQINKVCVRAKSNKKLSLLSLIVRNLIINGLIYLLAVILCVFIVPDNIYFIVISILGIIQISLILASMIMVVYRKDKKGLHDLIAGTWVASDK